MRVAVQSDLRGVRTEGGEVDPSGFMHQYYDWNAFERFIKELHAALAAAELRHVQFTATAIPLIDELEPDLKLHIHLRPEKALDPQFDLFSTRTGERGASLVGLLGEAHRLLLSFVSQLKQARDWSHRDSADIRVKMTHRV
ncbi:hypothetical protein BJD11_01075 (plasmid) [Xanthomonas euvesicatoria]|nr:hypothetical protein BJD11_01075 [Xanthomonas euvesicatoria]